MDARQTPDAVREAIIKYTQHYVGCAVYGSWADGEPKCSCGLDDARASLAALDSRPGDAGEGLERLRPMLENATWNKYPSAPDVPENWSLSIDNNRELASELLNMLPALLATPAPAVDALDHIRDVTKLVVTNHLRDVPKMIAADHVSDARKMVDRNAVIQECASALAAYCKRMNKAKKEPSFYDAYEAILAVRSGSSPAVDAQEAGRPCDTCQGNGEVVTDWDRYMHGKPGDTGDEATKDCPDCDGTGRVDDDEAVDAVPVGEVERPSDDELFPHLPESIDAAKRCGIQQSDWIRGWFVPWSPRNDNQNAEGPWSDWVALANDILAADAAAFASLSHGEGRK